MSLAKDILKVLAYYDIFHYPLTAREIYCFLHSSPCENDFDETLKRLCFEKRVFQYDDLYSLQDDVSLADHRRSDNQRAQVLLKTAYRISSFLFQFPYVRGVGISGSLSKNVAGEDADVDFFIITKANRLWIARSLMHLFKKFTFLVGKQHWFCMNYYIDEEALQITEKNIYTATEVVTLVPVCGNGALQKFYDANNWTQAYFPNNDRYTSPVRKSRPSLFKRSVEHLLDNSFGEILDNYLMSLTSRRWSKKELEGRLNVKGGRMGIRASKHFSKPNPSFFQRKVLLLYESKLNEIDHALHFFRTVEATKVQA